MERSQYEVAFAQSIIEGLLDELTSDDVDIKGVAEEILRYEKVFEELMDVLDQSRGKVPPGLEDNPGRNRN